MKKKIIMLMGMGLSICSLASHAGAMGDVAAASWATPYFGIEALYSWNTIDGYTINNHLPSVTTNGWGGRLSAGIDHPISEKVSLNAEVGGGYYGNTRANVPLSGIWGNFNITGYDFLVGGAYHFQSFDVLGDIGFMTQTIFATMKRDQGLQFPGGMVTGRIKNYASATEILPEIRVGGLYHVANHLSATLTYSYVFGSGVSGVLNTLAADQPPAVLQSSGSTNARNPSLSTVLFGLRYHFA
jgi:opacity protein-like surface antigen